jgi:hypothetical protein
MGVSPMGSRRCPELWVANYLDPEHGEEDDPRNDLEQIERSIPLHQAPFPGNVPSPTL